MLDRFEIFSAPGTIAHGSITVPPRSLASLRGRSLAIIHGKTDKYYHRIQKIPNIVQKTQNLAQTLDNLFKFSGLLVTHAEAKLSHISHMGELFLAEQLQGR